MQVPRVPNIPIPVRTRKESVHSLDKIRKRKSASEVAGDSADSERTLASPPSLPTQVCLYAVPGPWLRSHPSRATARSSSRAPSRSSSTRKLLPRRSRSASPFSSRKGSTRTRSRSRSSRPAVPAEEALLLRSLDPQRGTEVVPPPPPRRMEDRSRRTAPGSSTRGTGGIGSSWPSSAVESAGSQSNSLRYARTLAPHCCRATGNR